MRIFSNKNIDKKLVSHHVSFIFHRTMLFIIFIYCFFPLYWAINSSLKNDSQLMMIPTTLYPKDPHTLDFSLSFNNYNAVFSNEQFIRGIFISIVVSVITTLLALSIGSLASFALAKLNFKGKRVTLGAILSLTMFPQITILTGLYSILRLFQFHPLINMIFSYMIITLPLATWLLVSFFRKVPDTLIKAAMVDGANLFQVFYLILLPLSVPALVTTGLLTFIAAWNEYLFALTFTAIAPDFRTIPVTIALFSGSMARQQPFGEIMAATVIVTIPVIILVFIFQKRIISGLTTGAIKQ